MSNFELFAKIGGDSSELRRALTRAQKALGKASGAFKKLAKVGAVAFKGLSVGAGAAVASLGALTRSGLQFIDNQAKLARALNTSTESLRGVQIAAEESGLRDFDMSLERLIRRLGAAERGSAEYAKVVEQIGLNAAELNDLELDERLATIADAFRDSGMSMQQAARAAQILGFEQAKAATFFMRGGDAIRETTSRVREYGNAITDIEASMIEQTNDALNELKQVFEGIRVELAIQLSPLLKGAADQIMRMGKEAGGFRDLARPAVEAVVDAIVVLGEGLIKARRLVLDLSLSFSQFLDNLDNLRDFALFINPFGTEIEFISNAIGKLASSTGDASERTKGLQQTLNEVAQEGSFEAWVDKQREKQEALADAATNAANATREAGRVPFMLRQQGDEVPEMLQRGPEEPQTDFIPWWVQRYGEMKKVAEESFSDIEEFGLQAARNIQDSFATFLMDPFKDGLKGMLESFVKMLNEMVAQLIAKKALTSFFEIMSQGSGPVADFFGSMLEGTRATGGPMMARQPYMVGEKGPELVVPNKSSYVVPHNKLGGGGGMSLSVNINAEDPGAEGRIRTMIERDMAPQIIEAATGNTLTRLQRPRFA